MSILSNHFPEVLVARREGMRALSLVEYLTWLCRQDKHRPLRA